MLSPIKINSRLMGAALGGLIALVAAAGANAAIVTFGGSAHTVSARGQGVYTSEQVRTHGGVREVSVVTAASNGEARTDVTRRSDLEEGTLQLAFSHSRADGPFGLTHSRGYQQFSTHRDVAFRLSGFYELAGRGALRLHVFIYDLLQGQFVVSEEHVARSAGRLALGGGTEDAGISGVLAAGGRFAMWYHAYTFSWPGLGAASARGEVQLALSPTSQAVSEPSALWLLVAGIPLALVARRRHPSTGVGRP
ncbi:MAG: PEP-CTERM sorting domain-containing protein [Pseudomonadota bacterium]